MHDDVLRRYLLLGLRLGRHVDGYVDAYYGPQELPQQVDAEEPAAPADLAAEAVALRGELDGDGRARWLSAQLVGLETAARRVAGEPLAYADEVERCYGVRPELVPEEVFEAAHRDLDEALPGSGPLRDRLHAWLDAQTVPRDAVEAALRALTRELRDRTRRRWPLPAEEDVELQLVEHEPWSAFNYYLGGLRSRVAINLDIPLRAYRLPELVAHEIYPGHHTEHVRKEAALVHAEGWLEETIFLVPTPQSLVNEAIATNAFAALGEEADRAAAEIMAAHGAAYDPEVAAAIRRADDAFEDVTTNMALLLHERRRDPDEVVAYGVRWALRTEERSRKQLEFLTHPAWRAYSICYSAGRRLGAAFAHGGADGFGRLLAEQLTTADLLAA